MALTISKVPDIQYYLGKSGVVNAFQLQPAANDYVAGGYPITASNVELGKLVGAWMLLTNAAGATYLAQFIAAAGAFSPVGTPQTTINLKVSWASAAGAVFTEVPAGTDLSGNTWIAAFLGW
jgi:hypothetical protein